MGGMLLRLLRRTLGLLGAALAVFHGWLFASQAIAGRLEDPWLIFRWSAAAALVAALVAVGRSGSVWGRKGIAIWVLAALLHGPALSSSTADSIALPEAVATTVLQLLTSALVAGGLLSIARRLRARAAAAARFAASVFAFVPAGPFAGLPSTPFSPRPPPARA